MAMVLTWILIATVFSFSVAAPEEALISRIAFGSCANQSSPQPIWDAIVKFKPQVFIWLGDNIYGDIRRPFKLFGNERTIGPWKNVPRFVPSSVDEMQAKYKIAKSNDGYSRLREIAKVIGTWDDHDYGLNDAGKEFKGKDTNQKLMLDFLDEPHDSPRRKQAGVYASYTFGPEGRQIKVILLDTRYHRDPLRSDGTILGTAQWKWLQKELNSQPSAITIIGSSIQVVSNLSACTGPLFYMESWGRFPSDRTRLFKMISDSKRDGVLFISGDVHFGEITRFDCGSAYPLYDITASGLTQAVEKVIPSFLHFGLRFLAWVTPTTMRVMNNNCKYKSCTYGQPNFGVIQVNWDANPVSLRFEVRGVSGEVVNSVTTSLPELQTKNLKPPTAPTNDTAALKLIYHGLQDIVWLSYSPFCSRYDSVPAFLAYRCYLTLKGNEPCLLSTPNNIGCSKYFSEPMVHKRHSWLPAFSIDPFLKVLIVVQVGALYVVISLMVKCLRKCKLD